MGKVRENTLVSRPGRHCNLHTGRTYTWIVHATAMVNHCYFYGIDEDFSPFFLKVCMYFSYNAKLCINGLDYVEQRLAKAVIAFESLDNGILDCVNLRHVQQLQWFVGCEDRWLALEMVSPTATLLHHQELCRRLLIQRVNPSGQVLLDLGSGSNANRLDFLQGGNSREYGHRPARLWVIDLQAMYQRAHIRLGDSKFMQSRRESHCRSASTASVHGSSNTTSRVTPYELKL